MPSSFSTDKFKSFLSNINNLHKLNLKLIPKIDTISLYCRCYMFNVSKVMNQYGTTSMSCLDHTKEGQTLWFSNATEPLKQDECQCERYVEI